MDGARKLIRFIWRTICWSVFFNVAAEIVMLICSAAALDSSDFLNCLPVAALSIVLSVIAYWPLAVALGVGQIALAIYLGWRSMNDLFWKKTGRLARGAIIFFVTTQTLAVIVNNADFPVETAYKLAKYACTEGHLPGEEERLNLERVPGGTLPTVDDLALIRPDRLVQPVLGDVVLETRC
jgi:hypothetical protein